ncbi:MAG: indole-3-glycerol phosphate synthase TrpC [Synergistales bacterium]|nr:indole-3-glycerol phosphate synthase TrpC [Synergistales bacterium]
MTLHRIAAEKRREVERLRAPRRSLAEALGGAGLSVIAEIKRASPSAGAIAAGIDPRDQAAAYIRGGADALSVLTDGPFFGGSGADLRSLADQAGGERRVPLLRKDFLVDPLQIEESFFLGADAVLLIAALLEGPRLGSMLARVHELGMEALVEVHDEAELSRALEVPAGVIGINNRNLRDFTVDLSVAERLIAEMERLGAGEGRVVVAESGVATAEDAARLRAAGADAVLVGGMLMRAADPAAAVGALKGVPQR